jgi:mRNA-degrading endonuclease RelE of RelBE toxin-antitoxin system
LPELASSNDWRIRIGDYRVLYEIDEKVKAVRIMSDIVVKCRR